MPTLIFIFGSNLAGRHGKGAALTARRDFGAVYGQAEGMQGDSYAIPTKDQKLRPLPLGEIRLHVNRFLEFAEDHPEYRFKVTAIGTGLSGYDYEDIAPMFRKAPKNCLLPVGFERVLNRRGR